MQIIRFILGCLLIVAKPGFAETLTPDALRALMLEGDFEKAETELEEVYSEVKAGTFTYEDQRELYVAFSTTHPEVGQTIDLWLEAKPNSIHARTAKGWQQFHLSWIARGERTIRHTHPAAFDDMRAHLREIRQLMWSVYSDEPSFVPGSDGVLRSYLNGGNPTPIMDVISEIMALTPSYGSISRALHSVSPRWGGSVQEMNTICERFAHLVKDRPSYDAKRCNIISAIIEDLKGRPMAWALKELKEIPPEQEIYVHLYAATVLDLNEKPSTEQVMAWYREWGGYNQRIARSIEFNYGVKGFIDEEAERNAQREEIKLEYNPLSPELLLAMAKR